MANTAKNETPQHPGYARLVETINALPPSDARITLSLVTEHHAPVWEATGARWICYGCDPGPWGEDLTPDAPCSTLERVAECLGVAL